MSNSIRAITEDEHGDREVPRAVIHKKILDAAESRPDAPMTEIAEEVSGASLSTIERVLAEYGDPAVQGVEDGTDERSSDEAENDDRETAIGRESEQSIDEGGGNDTETEDEHGSEAGGDEEKRRDETDAGSDEYPSMDAEPERVDTGSVERTVRSVVPAEITEKRLETLREIRKRPNATQAELADSLGVTSPTINQRLNEITGFDWSERHEFVDALFDDEGNLRVAEPPSGDDSRAHAKPVSFESNRDAKSTRRCDEDTEGVPTSDRETTVRSNGGPDSDENADAREDELADRRRTDRRHVDPKSVGALATQVAMLTRKLETLQDRLAEEPPCAKLREDPELLHKVIQACVDADNISSEEELRILKSIVFVGRESD